MYTLGIIERICKALHITPIKLRHNSKSLIGIVVRDYICKLSFCEYRYPEL